MAYINLNEKLSVDLNNGQFVERTDILTEYSDKLKIYQSTTHDHNGQNFAWIKVAPHCSYDLYLVANSEQDWDYICISEGKLETLEWVYASNSNLTKHAGGDVNYRNIFKWTKTQISNDTDADKYYTVTWGKDGSGSSNEDIGMFAINITTETIEPNIPLIVLNGYISVALNNGQFVERTDILTKYSDKLKIYQSTTHDDYGQNFAWIKVAPQCSYDLYLIANSEKNADYICIFEGYVESWDYGSGGYLERHDGGYPAYSFLGNWKKIQISNNNSNENKYYTIIWSKDGGGSSNEDIGMFAINITTETIVPELDVPLVDLNGYISVALNNGQFVERTDILTEYSNMLKIYQSTTHDDYGQNFAWIKLGPKQFYDIYLIANSEYGNNIIQILEGYYKAYIHGSGDYTQRHSGGSPAYSFLGNWTKIQISNNNLNEDKYYTIIWSKNNNINLYEDIGMFAINITHNTIVPELNLPLINLNEKLSVDLNDGQFVERTDILTEYSNKLKIYQSTTHDSSGQNFAWIKVAPQCSYDLYLIANSEQNIDYICIFEGYYERCDNGQGGYVTRHEGGNTDYKDLSNWVKTEISNSTIFDKYYTVFWTKNTINNDNEDIGLFAINITNETLFIPPSNVLFQDNKRLFYFGNDIVRLIKYNDVNVNKIGTLIDYSRSNGVWSTIEGWVGIHGLILEQWNIMRPVWFKSNTFTDSNSLSISFNIFYRQQYANYTPAIGRQVNVMLSVYDADDNRISKQEKPIPCINEIGITEEENTAAGNIVNTVNSVGLYVPNTMSETQNTFNSFPDLYKVTFDDVTIPSGGRYEIFFTSVSNPGASWVIWDTTVKENILNT